MEQIAIDIIKQHPRNTEFFDDIAGDQWEVFLDSVRTSGVIEPVILTQDLITVSGHQRLRACKELKIENVMAEIRYYDSEDKVLKDLIETNIRQRGIGNPNPVKLGRCIKELEKIYGIQNGGDRKSDCKVYNLKSQEQLAEELGVSNKTLHNYKALADLTPEVQELIETGKLAPSTASSLISKMTEEEQEEFISSMDITKKITKAEVKKYLEEVDRLRMENLELHGKLENPKVVEKIPDNIQEIMRKAKESDKLRNRVDEAEKDVEILQREYDEVSSKWKKAEAEKKALAQEMRDKDPENNYKERIRSEVLMLCIGVKEFLEKYGGFTYLADEINEMDARDLSKLRKSVNAISEWMSLMDLCL